MAAGDRKKKLVSFEIDAQNDPIVCRAKWDFTVEAKGGAIFRVDTQIQTVNLGEAAAAEALSILAIKAKLTGEVQKEAAVPEVIDTEAKKPPVAPPPQPPVVLT